MLLSPEKNLNSQNLEQSDEIFAKCQKPRIVQVKIYSVKFMFTPLF